MAKQYVLTESDRRLLSGALARMRANPPRPVIARISPTRSESADSWWALPPCETGLAAAPDTLTSWVQENSNFVEVERSAGLWRLSTWCCLWKLSVGSGALEPVLNIDGSPVRVLVWNVANETINGFVQVHQAKDGFWYNSPSGVANTTTPTTSTTEMPDKGTSPLCYGDCLWVSKPLGGGAFAWAVPPGGNCRNTTTPEPPPPPPPETSTSTTSTTPPPCQSPKNCRLRCLPRPTTTSPPGGTTAWPPAPTWQYTYQVVSDLYNFPCTSPCTCYGAGDPCLLGDAEVVSKCINVQTTTSTTTTTSIGGVTQDTDPCSLEAAFNPNRYVASKMVFGSSHTEWFVCNDCPEGKKPVAYPTDMGQNAYSLYNGDDAHVADIPATMSFYGLAYTRVKTARTDPTGTVTEYDSTKPSIGRWRFETGCMPNPCTMGLGGPTTAETNEAEYRALSREDIYIYILQNALQIWGIDWLHEEYFGNRNRWLAGEDFDYVRATGTLDTAAVDFLFREMYVWRFSAGQAFVTGLGSGAAYWHWLDWNICKTCPDGTRPERPPRPVVATSSDSPYGPYEGDGAIEGGVWTYKTKCVPGPSCDLCPDRPIYISPDTRGVVSAPGAPEPPVSTTPQPDCGCYPPTFCPVASGECTRTRCAPGGPNSDPLCSPTTRTPTSCYDTWHQRNCNCNTSTTSTTSTTTASPSTAPPNCGNCSWKSYQQNNTGNNWLYYWGLVTPCLLPERGCGCAYPAAGPTSCGQTTQTPCTTQPPQTTTTQPCPPCSGIGCMWYGTQGGAWVKMEQQTTVAGVTRITNPDGTPTCCRIDPTGGSLVCAGGRTFGGSGYDYVLVGSTWVPCTRPSGGICGCSPPNYPSTGCERGIFTPCISNTTPAPCACCYSSTTTTTLAPCQRSCVYKGNGTGGWTKIFDPCQASCLCPAMQGQSHDGCDRVELRCGSQPTTTSSTTTTSTTSPPTGACCYSSVNPTGCVVTNAAACAFVGGLYQGNGTTCDGVPCPATTTTTTTTTTLPPLGRCCFMSQLTCLDTYQSNCNGVPGETTTWTQGVTCAGSPCSFPTTTTTTTTPAPLGRCCWPSGVCSNGYTQHECNQVLGSWLLNGTCALNPCTTTTTTTGGPPPTTIPPE